jgi:hypothetical protein
MNWRRQPLSHEMVEQLSGVTTMKARLTVNAKLVQEPISDQCGADG